MKKYIIGLDEGTTSVRSVVYDVRKGQIVYIKRIKFKQHYPQDGWVEHDAEEIYQKTLETLEFAFNDLKLKASEIFSLAITNQRETIVAWNRETGEAVYNAIVWQCRRTSDICQKLKRTKGAMIKRKTGLIVDSYFSATKMAWILENVPQAKKLYEEDKLCFGTIESYLVFRLSDKESYISDITNASRTMLFNIKTKKWDKKLLKLFSLNEKALPKVVDNCGELAIAKTKFGKIKICGMIGDQQSSLFGQGCHQKGQAKNTFGTGCFILINSGEKPIKTNKLLTTIAWKIGNKTTYALEGSVFNSGASLEWLRDGLNLIENSRETSQIATSIPNNGDVYFVPALTGLGAPYWDSYARGMFIGLNRATTRKELVRAVLESMAYSIYDITDEMQKHRINLKELRCDGGVSNNDFLMQFQADLLGVKLLRQPSIEATVLGAIYMAGIGCGIFTEEEVCKKIEFNKEYLPNEIPNKDQLLDKWHDSVKRSLNFKK